jgi:hypothetical protein
VTVSYGNLAAPPFKKGSDSLTAAIAVTPFKDGDFDIDCDGCTACCHGDDGPIILPEEAHDYACHKDAKGNMRLDQVDGSCVYLEGAGCGIHAPAFRLTISDYEKLAVHEELEDNEAVQQWLEECAEAIHQEYHIPFRPPKICRDFDCRSIIVKFNNRGLDFMVNSKQLPIDVVIQGRAKLKQFNDMINTRALSGGADLSGLLMAPAEEEPHDAA